LIEYKEGVGNEELNVIDTGCMQPQFSLKEVELFLSQVLHDLISPFSALSAGVDLLMDIPEQEELISLLHCSKQQLSARLSFFRALFGYGGQDSETLRLLESHLSEQQVTYDWTQTPMTKALMALCFWASKQLASKTGHVTVRCIEEEYVIEISDVRLRHVTSEDAILLGEALPTSPRDTYAFFTKMLLMAEDRQLSLYRSSDSLKLSLKKRG
jgi:hypothetical protein